MKSAFFLLLTLFLFAPFHTKAQLGPAEELLDFMQKNQERASLALWVDDSLIATQHPDRVSPLASTVKIVLAIEYAEQVAAGKLQADSLIPLADLDRYYIPFTDGGAHPRWLKEQSMRGSSEAVPLLQVARGMIRYSSNANTEYLIRLLGKEAIEARMDTLELDPHTPIYPVVSALLVAREQFPSIKGKALKDSLRSLSDTAYRQICWDIHEKLTADTTGTFKKLSNLSFGIQRVWSDRLPASSPAVYAGLLRKINERSFGPEVHAALSPVLESIMESPGNQSWLKHAGMKGGSTAFVLTKATYATTKEGTRFALAYFFTDLTFMEISQLQQYMNPFELGILQDEEFRSLIVSALAK